MIEPRRVEKSSSGYTLLELLVAVTILGLILVALTNGLSFAGKAWEIQERRSERQGDIDAVQSMLRHLVASASDLEGDANSFRFVNTLPVALSRGGLYDIELRMSANRLRLAWKPHFKGATRREPSAETNLLSGVTGFELAYYIRQGGWQRVLKAGTRPPALVRVELQLGGDRVWPPLVVAPMLDVLSRNQS